MPILLIFAFIAAFLTVLYVSEWVYHKFEIPSEITRKSAHVIACLTSLSFVVLFNSHWYILFLGLVFFTILYLSKKMGWYPSIDQVDRQTRGSYLMPLGIYITFMLSDLTDGSEYFILSILILGISDPAAGLTGTYWPKNRNFRLGGKSIDKTYAGSVAFWISSFLLTLIWIYFTRPECTAVFLVAAVISTLATCIEVVSTKGWDNVSVPIGVFLLLYYGNI